jgi:hypothetical protein
MSLRMRFFQRLDQLTILPEPQCFIAVLPDVDSITMLPAVYKITFVGSATCIDYCSPAVRLSMLPLSVITGTTRQQQPAMTIGYTVP